MNAAPVNHDSYPDSYIRGILESVKSIAIVGASQNDVRPSFFVTRYLIEKGYRVFPVNPGVAGQTILGRPVLGRLKDVPEPLDMVEVFRGSEHAPAIVEEALALDPRPKVIWMQLGVRNDEAGVDGGGGRPERRHEPLSQDRIRKAFRRDRVGRRQFPCALLKEADPACRLPAPRS